MNIRRSSGPKGSFVGTDVKQPDGGFMGFATGGFAPSDTIVVTYDMRIPEDFQFGRGGYLPCFYGGYSTTKTNISCNLIWDKNGRVALFTTFPDLMKNADVYFNPTPYVLERDGEWHTIRLEAVMNSGTKGNGIVRISVDGEDFFVSKKILFRTKATDKFEGISFDAFYRGKNGAVQDAAPADTHIDFANVSLQSKK